MWGWLCLCTSERSPGTSGPRRRADTGEDGAGGTSGSRRRVDTSEDGVGGTSGPRRREVMHVRVYVQQCTHVIIVSKVGAVQAFGVSQLLETTLSLHCPCNFRLIEYHYAFLSKFYLSVTCFSVYCMDNEFATLSCVNFI